MPCHGLACLRRTVLLTCGIWPLSGSENRSYAHGGPVHEILDEHSFSLPAGGFDLASFERSIIEKAMAMHGNNQTKTAAYLNMSRRVLQGKLKKMNS